MLDKAVLAVQSVFIFTLFAGLTVLLAAVQSSRDERRFESAMLRTLGASRNGLQGVLAEFTVLGLLSGRSPPQARRSRAFVATRVLVPYGFDPWLPLLALAAARCWCAQRLARHPQRDSAAACDAARQNA